MEDCKLKVNADILMFAFRYALGRQTFAPTIVCEAVKENIEYLDVFQRKQMTKEIIEQGKYGYGMQCDKDTWLRLKRFLDECISQ